MNCSEQPSTTADGEVLSWVSVEILLKELLRRGNEALEKGHHGEANRLLRAVLGYSPNDGMILQAIAELALVHDDWTEAAACAGRALETTLSPHVFMLACCAA